MKKDILKMVGAKNDKEFYAMFPNTPEGEEMFMAKYGKKIKSLQLGAKMTTAPNGLTLPPVMQGLNYNFGQYSNEPQGLGYNISGDPNGQMYNIGEGMGGIRPLSGPSMQQTANTNTMGNAPKLDILGKLKDNIDLPGKIVKGITSLKEEKKERQKAEQWRDVSNITLAASQTRPEQARRRYVRPEDAIIQPGELNNPYGESYAKDGASVRSHGEIMNVYNNPNVPRAAGGFTSFLNAGGSDMIDNTTDWMYGKQENAGKDLGGDLGGAVGNLFGPVGGLIGSQVGKFAGWALDRNPQKTKKANNIFDMNLNNMAFGNRARGVQQQYASNMEDGGYISNDWQPQVITKFGDHTMRSLLAPDKTMDTLRTGGNLRSNLTDMEQSGELQTYWGGHAEPMSENPYLPDGGQMVEFKGNSHEESDGRGRTGIGMSFGNSPVEVERGEPAVKLEDGGNSESLTVFGNMQISKEGAKLIGDPDAANMKFKGYTKELADKTSRANKLIEKSTNKVNDLQVITSFDKLTLNSLGANIMGSNMKLKEYADKTQKAANLQQAINDTAEEHGIVADDLSRGRIKTAKGGINIDSNKPGMISKFLSDTGEAFSSAISNIANDRPNPHKPLPQHNPPTSMAEIWQDMTGTRQTNTPTYAADSTANQPGRISNFLSKTGDMFGEALSNIANDKTDLHKPLPAYNPPTNMTEVWQNMTGTRNNDNPLKLAGGDTVTNFNRGNEPYTAEWEKKWAENKNYDPWLYNWPWRMRGVNNAGKSQSVQGNPSTATTQKPSTGKGTGKGTGRAAVKQLETIDTSQAPYVENSVDTSGMNLTPELINRPYTEVGTTPGTPSDNNNFPWINAINSMVPWFRPSDAEHLDPRQLAGEMYAMSTNQLEPVQAQSYEPRLRTPYKVSFQDQINEVTAQSRAARKATGYNPAAQAAIAAQSYAPITNIMANEFRTNQGIADQIYAGNLATLNDAQLKNLGIFDTQYQRQEGAKSATKATNIEALKSVSDKYLKNQLENRTLQIMENMYGYRFGPGMRAFNWNQPAQFNTTIGQDARATASGIIKNDKGEELLPVLDKTGNVTGYRVKEEVKTTKSPKSRNGSIIRDIKNL